MLTNHNTKNKHAHSRKDNLVAPIQQVVKLVIVIYVMSAFLFFDTLKKEKSGSKF